MEEKEQEKKKKKFIPSKITFQQQEQPQKFSENGSLILHEFRLNEGGMKIQNQQLLQDLSQIQSQSNNFSFEKLKPIGFLGEGASGKVEKVQHTETGQIYAMKKIPISSDEIQLKQISEELKLMLECDSPYVIKCYGAFYKVNSVLHIILEYMDAGSIANLLSKVKKFTEPIMALLAQQILLGIDYLHNKRKIIHRDIKPQNILINSQGEIKITDFGISATSQTLEKKQTYVGTAIYMSPERLQGDQYGRDSDLWSLGIMMAECLIGYHPIAQKGVNFIQMVENISNFKVQEYNGISQDMKSVIEWCCRIKLDQRPTTQDLLQSKIIRRAEKVDRKIFVDWLRYVISK